MALRRGEPRAAPLPDVSGEEVVRELLRQIDEEDELSRALGLDLAPPDPRPEYGPATYPPLDVWLLRSEEVHRFLQAQRKAARHHLSAEFAPRGTLPLVEPARQRLSYAEYLALEAASDVKHEFVSGAVVAMAGGTIEHGRLASQLTVLLRRVLEGKPCVVLPSDVRVRIRASERATYPDLHVVCGRVERDPEDEHAVVNPIVIVEVLSSSTAESDRGDKFAAYRRLRSLREYVLVSQEQRRVDVYRRDGRRWVLEEFSSNERFRLEAMGIELSVDEIYTDPLGAIVEP